jgi:large subunit ribosomal protein L25
MTTLNASKRDGSKKPDALRAEGLVPAVVYGKKFTSTSIAIPKEALIKAWKEAGASSIVNVMIDGESVNCIIHQIDSDPTTDALLHVDLLAVDMTQKVEVSVELEFIGEAPAVKSGLGSLEKILHAIEIEALPKDLPKSIEVDLSSLANVGDHITLKDIKLPSGVTAKGEPEDTIVTITGAHEESEEPSAPIDFSAIEVEQKGKKDEEGEGEAGESEAS